MIIEVSQLSHRFDKTVALDSVSFSVRAGTRFGILGPNGSGKSTLFNVLSTLVPPQSGAVRLFDSNPASPSVRARLGVVFQSPALDNQLTGLENLTHHARLYSIPVTEIRARAGQLLDELGLAETRHKKVTQLSGGTRRRLELAKVLITRPEILLLDEPTTGLDPIARREFWQLLDELRLRRQLTVVYSTHLFDEVSGADCVLILNRGRVVAEGDPNGLMAELGRDLLCAQTADGERVATVLRASFGLNPLVAKGRVYADVQSETRRLPEIYGALSGLASKITIGQPELEDVFHVKTGEVISQSIEDCPR